MFLAAKIASMLHKAYGEDLFILGIGDGIGYPLFLLLLAIDGPQHPSPRRKLPHRIARLFSRSEIGDHADVDYSTKR